MAKTKAAKRRIGFVDFELENFHANVYLAAFRKELADRGFTVTACTAMREESGRAWAEKNGVAYVADPVAMDDAVDFYMVLAPSNPETHLALCRQVFRFGKPTYVDKTFTTDTATAKKIFALADRHKVVMQTTSALRYTNVQAYVNEAGREKVKHMVTWGGGRSFEEYAIHPLELAVSCLGPKVTTMMRRGTGNQSQLLLNLTGDRTAVVNVYANARTPFAAAVTTDEGTRYIEVDTSRLFLDMAAAILDLFENRKAAIDRAESLTIRRVLDRASDPAAQRGFVRV
jgi:predicted dehydrogenase